MTIKASRRGRPALAGAAGPSRAAALAKVGAWIEAAGAEVARATTPAEAARILERLSRRVGRLAGGFRSSEIVPKKGGRVARRRGAV